MPLRNSRLWHASCGKMWVLVIDFGTKRVSGTKETACNEAAFLAQRVMHKWFLVFASYCKRVIAIDCSPPDTLRQYRAARSKSCLPAPLLPTSSSSSAKESGCALSERSFASTAKSKPNASIPGTTRTDIAFDLAMGVHLLEKFPQPMLEGLHEGKKFRLAPSIA
eukprot:3514227-Rhodomonas_salina.5